MSLHDLTPHSAFLTVDDPLPVERVNLHGASRFVVVCEHAGRAIPKSLGDLGIPAGELDRHIAYDIGAEGVARRLALVLHAPLLMQRYSRLVIDCNRPLEAVDCIPEWSDGTVIPANRELSSEARRTRFQAIHKPFHDAIDALLEARQKAGVPTILLTVHSFTPVMRHTGEERLYQLGLLSNRDDRFALAFMKAFVSICANVPVAWNKPYIIDDISDYTIPIHGERRGIPHVLIEVRNDLLSCVANQQRWAEMLAASAGSAIGGSDGNH